MATKQQGYWTDDGGRNLLKGIPDDTENPLRMTDEMIIYAIQHSQVARLEFDRVFPGLLQGEKDRLTTLFADNPWRTRLIQSVLTAEDKTQNRAINRIPVRTAGPRGGMSPTQISVRR